MCRVLWAEYCVQGTVGWVLCSGYYARPFTGASSPDSLTFQIGTEKVRNCVRLSRSQRAGLAGKLGVPGIPGLCVLRFSLWAASGENAADTWWVLHQQWCVLPLRVLF